MNFYEVFKYIRNQLREYRKDAAYVFMQKYWEKGWGKSILDGHQEVLPNPWHLLTILKWSVIYGQAPGSTRLKIFDQKAFSKIYNALNDAPIPSTIPPLKDQIALWKFLRCLIFNQAPYQFDIRIHGLCAQKIIFKDIGLNYDVSGKLITNSGVNLDEFLLLELLVCGFIAFSPNRRTFKIKDLSKIFSRISENKVSSFLGAISLDFDQLIHFMQTHHEYVRSPEKEYYAISPLVEKPFLRNLDTYIPYDKTTLLLHLNYSIYDLLKKLDGENFSPAFGEAFEKYVAAPLNFLKKTYLSENEIQSQFSVASTVDYLILEGQFTIGIECKSMGFHPQIILDPSYENLVQILKPFLIKAYSQIRSTATAIKINRGTTFDKEKLFFVILTFKQMLFGSPQSNWDEFIERSFQEKYGQSEIDFIPKNVFVLSLYDFDFITAYLSKHQKGMGEALSTLYNRELDPDHNISIISQFHDQTINPLELPYLKSVHDSLFSEIKSILTENA